MVVKREYPQLERRKQESHSEKRKEENNPNLVC